MKSSIFICQVTWRWFVFLTLKVREKHLKLIQLLNFLISVFLTAVSSLFKSDLISCPFFNGVQMIKSTSSLNIKCWELSYSVDVLETYFNFNFFGEFYKGTNHISRSITLKCYYKGFFSVCLRYQSCVYPVWLCLTLVRKNKGRKICFRRIAHVAISLSPWLSVK